MTRKVTVNLPAETVQLLDTLTENSGTGSRGRTIQLLAETVRDVGPVVERLLQEGARWLSPEVDTARYVVNVATVCGLLNRFYEKPREKAGES